MADKIRSRPFQRVTSSLPIEAHSRSPYTFIYHHCSCGGRTNQIRWNCRRSGVVYITLQQTWSREIVAFSCRYFVISSICYTNVGFQSSNVPIMRIRGCASESRQEAAECELRRKLGRSQMLAHRDVWQLSTIKVPFGTFRRTRHLRVTSIVYIF
jgi:hypothetical protein